MPMYDRRCAGCGATRRDCYEPVAAADGTPCACGGLLERVWLPQAGPTVIDDTWPGGRYFEHVSHTGETFYSRSELKRFLAATGQLEYVRHQGTPGSDKSPHTSRWV